jgi:hypothetical protein
VARTSVARTSVARTSVARRGPHLRSADLSANLSSANLSGADLRSADLRSADLSGADLSGANLSGADLSSANLSGAHLSGAHLRSANLSSANGLPDSLAWFRANFKKTKDGVVVYKCFNGSYTSNSSWSIQPGSVLVENCNPNLGDDCGCGINFATREWVEKEYPGKPVWRCLIRWAWLPGVVIPWGTNGKARCSKLQLIREVGVKA